MACDYQTSKQCVSRPKLGEDCMRRDGDSCAVGLLCGDDEHCAPPVKKPGDACSQAWECEGANCVGCSSFMTVDDSAADHDFTRRRRGLGIGSGGAAPA